MKKLIFVGANGTIGGPLTRLLTQDYELVIVGYSAGDYRVDLSSKESIASIYDQNGSLSGRHDLIIYE